MSLSRAGASELLKQAKVSNLAIISMNKQIEWQNKLKVRELAFFVALVVFVIMYYVYQKAVIRKTYQAMIAFVDGQRNEENGYKATNGETIAFYYLYPHLPGNPFRNIHFPAAVVYSFYTQGWNSMFTSKDANHLQELFLCADRGGCGKGATDNQSALSMICNSWALHYPDQIRECMAPCPYPSSSGGAGSYISGVGSMALNGAMMGGMTENPIGIAVGAAVGAVVGGLMTFFSNKSKKDKCLESQKHCIPQPGTHC